MAPNWAFPAGLAASRSTAAHARRDLLEKLEALAAQVVFERALHKEIVVLTGEPEGKCAAIVDRDVADRS